MQGLEINLGSIGTYIKIQYFQEIKSNRLKCIFLAHRIVQKQ